MFPEVLASKKEARMVCEAIRPVPILLNMMQNGVTPEISVEEVRDIGFRIVIYPSAALRGAIAGMTVSLGKVKEDGVEDVTDNPKPKDAFSLCGLPDCMQIDKEAGLAAFSESRI